MTAGSRPPMSSTGRTALVLSGGGRYSDPWHPFDETSNALASLLQEKGFEVQINGDVDGALGELTNADTANLPALLAVNVGLPRDGGTSPGTPAASMGLTRWLASNRPLLVSHSSITSFQHHPGWEDAVGGRWVRGTSMHPDYGGASITVHPGPVVRSTSSFEVNDERYSYLRTSQDIRVHASHTYEEQSHPLMWSLERPRAGSGTRRTFYDALGHDAASYQSPEHRQLLSNAVDWLMEVRPTPRPSGALQQ